MTYASAHDEEVEHFVGAEELMFRIEDRQLQGIDDTAHGVDDAAGQQPEKSGRGQSFQQRPEYQDTYPAHGNVDHRGKPLGTADPEGVNEDSGCRDGPHQGQQKKTGPVPQHNQADGSVGSGNQNENHHVVKLAQKPVYLF